MSGALHIKHQRGLLWWVYMNPWARILLGLGLPCPWYSGGGSWWGLQEQGQLGTRYYYILGYSLIMNCSSVHFNMVSAHLGRDTPFKSYVIK